VATQSRDRARSGGGRWNLPRCVSVARRQGRCAEASAGHQDARCGHDYYAETEWQGKRAARLLVLFDNPKMAPAPGIDLPLPL